MTAQSKSRYWRNTGCHIVQRTCVVSAAVRKDVFHVLEATCVHAGDGVMGLAGYRLVYSPLYKYKIGDISTHRAFWGELHAASEA